jgi:Ca2+-binding EF-hand superfamily protein
MPAGQLTVYLDRAKDLAFPETHKPLPGEVVRMDPYVSLNMEGKAVKMVKRTPADKDGGSDPVWQSSINFDVVDQYQVDLEVFNQSGLGKDIPLGMATISLLNVFRSGSMENWISLKQKKANGGIKEIGDVFVRMTFTGPVAIAYPQFRPEVDSFDDALRKIPAPKQDSDSEVEEEIPPVIDTIAVDDLPTEEAARLAAEMQERAQQDKLPPEFTEDEIINAFKFIDLDHNNFVGAAEIRHILVCMGEMITDEEIDMMISMVDMDGDGQVSLKEFRALVLHPNPGVVDMHKEINKHKDLETMKEKQALAGKMQGLDLTTFQRQKEITVREQKKKMIVSFVVDNEVDFSYIKRAHMKFVELVKEKRVGGRVRFPEFCSVLDVEPIQEYKNLHAYYDSEEMGDMDIREFFLSMLNFVDVDKETRIKFSFEMYDEMKTGFISQAEVEEILKGNHMLSIASVRRKADTIMRQSNSTKKGSITMNEFVVVSKKFPNILLPAVGFVPQFKSTEVIA